MSKDTGKPDRLFYIDNIRWLVIVSVVLLHTAVTYSGIGSWYYKEPANLDPISFLFFGIFLSFTQAYSMGLLFLIAGYFVPAAFDRKGFFRFLGDRGIRLGIPTLIYMLLINTAIVYYILAFQWDEQRPPLGKFLENSILSLDFLGGSGPMWFALALLIFSAFYAIFRLFLPVRGLSARVCLDRDLGGPKSGESLPGHMAVVGLILLISSFAFLIRIVFPIGTSIMNMQLSFFSQYVILFSVGIIAYRRNWLLCIPYSFGMTWLKASLLGGFAFWMAIMIIGGGSSGDISKYSGGVYWQAAAYALWESFFGVGMSIGLLVLFRERFNEGGRLERFLSENSFSVYVFHAPILILVTLALRGFAWHPLIKFAVAGIIAVAACFAISHLVLRRIPLLKRVL